MVVPRSSRRTVTVPRGRWMAASWSLTGARGTGERESEAAGCRSRGPGRRLRAGVGPDQRHVRRRSGRTFVCDQGKCRFRIAGRAVRPRREPRRPDRRARRTASPSVSNTTPTDGATSLPRTVLLAAPPGDKPDAAAVAGRIRAVSRAGVGGVYSGSVVDVGTGKSLFSHRAGAAEIPASVNKLLTSAAVLSMLGPEHRFTTSVVAVREEADHPGRGRRPVPGHQDDVVHLPGARLGRRSGQEDRRRPEEGEAHLGHARLRRRPVHRSGLEPDLAERVRRPGHPDLGAVGRRGPARRRIPRTADERPGRAGRQGVRRRAPQAGHQGHRHRRGRRPRRATRGSPRSLPCRWSGSSSRC